MDETAATAVNGNPNKQPLTRSQFVVEFEYGASNQGYWDYNHMVLQLEDCIDCLQALHGDKYDFMFLFDHSSGHDKQRPNGLSVTQMIKHYGGSQPEMRDSKMTTEDHFGPYPRCPEVGQLQLDEVQSMQYRAGDRGPYNLSEEERIQQKDDKDTAATVFNVKPLDEQEHFQLKNNPLGRQKVTEILRQVLQESTEGWDVKAFLKGVQRETPGFDFRINENEKGRPTGVVWMTSTMRQSWIRFGNTIFLDAMKRKLNNLHWPYIGPVALDHEKCVVTLVESLVFEESLDQYAFTINSMAEMEPRRGKKSICLIFADCFVTDELLEMIGLERPTTCIIWDSFHLKAKVWPEYLGQFTYNQIKTELGLMIYGETREVYDAAYEKIAVHLRSDPAKLQYLKDYYDRPDRFALFFIKQITGNLGKTSSQPAEANHSSVITHLGPGSAQTMVSQISDLFERQETINARNAYDDAKYEKTTSFSSNVMTIEGTDPAS